MEGGNAAPNFKMTDKIFDIIMKLTKTKTELKKMGCRNLLWGVEETKGQGLFSMWLEMSSVLLSFIR